MRNGTRRIKSEKLREHQYIERYARCLKSKRVEWDEGRSIEKMWEQVKQPMIDSAGEVKVAVKRKETLQAMDEDGKERCMEAYKEKFERNMNQDVDGNRK